MRTRAWIAAACSAVVLTTSCSSGDEPTEGSAGATPTSTPEVTEVAPAQLALVEVCPQVEQALPESNPPEGAEYDGLVSALGDLYDVADPEARNALEVMIEPLREVGRLSGEQGPEAFLDARQAYRDAIEAFAGRCAAAGSSALQ